MNEHLVTVAIPSYNRPRLLAEAIASVLAQDYKDFTLLVADDASSFDAAALVASFGDPRIQLHRHPRRVGLVPAWRWCLRTPKTRYIALLEDDCVWLPHHLGKAVAALEQHPRATFYCAASEIFGTRSGIIGLGWSDDQEPRLCDWRDTGFRVWLHGTPPMAAASVVLRGAALDGLHWGGRTWPWCHDYFWWGQLALKGPFVYDPTVGVRTRWHDSNITHSILRNRRRTMPQWRFALRMLAAKAYAQGALDDLAAELRDLPAGPVSAVVVALAAAGNPPGLARQARAIFDARRDLTTDPACTIHYRIAARLGGWYLTYAEFVARVLACWWPHPAL